MATAPPDDFGLEVNILRFGRDMVDYLNDYPDRQAVCTLMANAAPLIPAEHMFLAAVAHGLRACFVGHLDVRRASQILGLPPDIACLFLLPVGYPAEEPEPKAKLSSEEISFRNVWGE